MMISIGLSHYLVLKVLRYLLVRYVSLHFMICHYFGVKFLELNLFIDDDGLGGAEKMPRMLFRNLVKANVKLFISFGG